MQIHFDMRLRNTNGFKVSEKIGSMRNKAAKVTSEYLWSKWFLNLNNMHWEGRNNIMQDYHNFVCLNTKNIFDRSNKKS